MLYINTLSLMRLTFPFILHYSALIADYINHKFIFFIELKY